MIDLKELFNYLPQNGRIVIRCEDGKIVGFRLVANDEHIATLKAFIELARSAGYTVMTSGEKSI